MKWFRFLLLVFLLQDASAQNITSGQLLLQPGIPGFLRQGDHMELTTLLTNSSAIELTGQVQLELLDARSGQSVDGWFVNTFPNQYFTVGSRQQEQVKFPIQVPMQFAGQLVWRITAGSGDYSDVKEGSLPVLADKVLKTETLAAGLYNSETTNFSFHKLLQSDGDEGFQNRSITLEWASSPAWYAVSSLPSLVHAGGGSSEQLWYRYFALALARKITGSSPGVQHARWVDSLAAVASSLPNVLDELKAIQNADGSFPWFRGGMADRYMTQNILMGLGRLKNLNAIPPEDDVDISKLANKALVYLDQKIKDDYEELKAQKNSAHKNQIPALIIQYLYTRSFFPEQQIPRASEAPFRFFQNQVQTLWKEQDSYSQAMIALALYRGGDKETATAILSSLKATGLANAGTMPVMEKNARNGSEQYTATEGQSLLLEALHEIKGDKKTNSGLLLRLIENKEPDRWATARATAAACYVLLLNGTKLTTIEDIALFKLGPVVLTNQNPEHQEWRTWFKQEIPGERVAPPMGNIVVQLEKQQAAPSPDTSWFSAYWQYFEEFSKTNSSSPFTLHRKLFVERKADGGTSMKPADEVTELHLGDKIKVVLELQVERDADYVHLCGSRASALEPIDLTSGHRKAGSTRYFQTAGRTSIDFYFDHLQKGHYRFEYTLVARHLGNFSMGVSLVECINVPASAAYSEGARIDIEE